MLTCLRLHYTQSTNIFPSSRFKSLSHHIHRYRSHIYFTQNAQNTEFTSLPKRCIHVTSAPSTSSALAQEHSKYESNTLPKNARVVICGGGVMGGKFHFLHLFMRFFSLTFFVLWQFVFCSFGRLPSRSKRNWT